MIKKTDIVKFEKICASLNTLIRKIRKYCPEATYYVNGEIGGCDMNLMTSDSHTNDKDILPLQKNVVKSIDIDFMNCGGW